MDEEKVREEEEEEKLEKEMKGDKGNKEPQRPLGIFQTSEEKEARKIGYLPFSWRLLHNSRVLWAKLCKIGLLCTFRDNAVAPEINPVACSLYPVAHSLYLVALSPDFVASVVAAYDTLGVGSSTFGSGSGPPCLFQYETFIQNEAWARFYAIGGWVVGSMHCMSQPPPTTFATTP